MSITQAVIEKLEALPPEKQQEVLDFVEFLQTRVEQQPALVNSPVSFMEAAQEFIGCLDGPGDLSTNPKYMEGYGQS